MTVLYSIISGFVPQLFCAEIIFAWFAKKRKFFIPRAAAATVLFAAMFFVPDDLFKIGWFDFRFLLLLIASLFLMWLCFEERPLKILSFGVGAYAAQHLAYNLTSLICRISGVRLFFADALTILLFALCFCAVYTACFFFFGRKMKPGGKVEKDRIQLIAVSTIIILIVYVLSMYMVSQRLIMHYGVMLYAICCCAMALYVQFSLFERNKLLAENKTITHMLREAEQQRRAAKDNIDFINIKCHDLKKQIAALRALDDKKARDESIREIENAVMFFESVAKTGNESLDIILTEKSVQCEKRGIDFTYIADGSKLDFMNPVDIYLVFENAIENAIESVMTVADAAKRIISLNVGTKAKLLSVHMENYLEKPPVLENGMPVTTKDDKAYHGYGLKSIRFIAEKYGGNMEISVREDRFVLDILMPIPQN